jgi:serine/threonine-protein kinase
VDAAAQVADGAPVNWADAEMHADAANRRLVRHLRLVESIASLHRSISPSENDDYVGVVKPASDQLLGRGAAGPHWGRLSILDRIGHGTSCDVFRAWDTALHREVALKLLHDDGDRRDAQERVLEEARRLARVRHPHVVQVYGAEEHDNRVGLWMELVRGESLEQAVHARGEFGAREAALIGLDLCAAVAAVHGAGLLHRDIKAQNVMRETGGRLVLMDFGTGEELSGTNRLVGTPLYLAPEVFRGQRASVQSDIYSLGVLLYYLVTRKFPVIAGSMEELAQAHARRERQPLRDLRPDLPEAFVGTVERALDSDPSRRYQSVGELESSLRESLDAPSARAAVQPAPAASRRPHIGVAFAAAAVVLVALIAALIVWTGRLGQGSPTIGSLAVLPLVDRSASSSELSDAVTEQFIATLGQIDSLRTTSLASTLPFKDSKQPIPEIASLLGVDAVLRGDFDVVKQGTGPDQVRLQANLVSGASGQALWSGTFQASRGEIRTMLSQAATALASAVNAPLTGPEKTRLTQVRSTNAAAEEAYFQGRLHLAGYGPEPARRALASFQRAVALDDSYAAAHAGAALAYVKLAGFGVVSHADARVSARAEIRKAVEHGEGIAEAHAAEADIRLLYDWDWRGAEKELRRSLDLNPGFTSARNVYAQLLAAERRFDEALAISGETLQIDPNSTTATVNHGMILYYKRDFTGAQEFARRALAQDPSDPAAHVLEARVLEAQGQYDKAFAAAKRTIELTGNPGVSVRVVAIRLMAMAGYQDEAREAAAELENAGRQGTLRVRPRDLAYLHLGFGRPAAALDAFESAFDERDPSLVWLPVDPRVDPLRREPRFATMLKKLSSN